jgi:16S rRNA (cytosine1402-N4)-methyltransferase
VSCLQSKRTITPGFATSLSITESEAIDERFKEKSPIANHSNQNGNEDVWNIRSLSTGAVVLPSSALIPPNRPGYPPVGVTSVEGLLMPQTFSHEPVMVDEVVDAFKDVPAGAIVDATVGGGGHAAAILDANDRVRIVGIDRDPEAVVAARERLEPYGERAKVYQARFDELVDVAESDGVQDGELSGVLFDLGVSSPQLDRAERGFSIRNDGPLDMRMSPGDPASPTASELLNSLSEGELIRIFVANGEGKMAGRIARRLVAGRPYETTGQLADAVSQAVPAAVRRRGHTATRVFQALRIEVNEELDQLAQVLPHAIRSLAPDGRCVAIAYHSGEDRIVKAAFNQAATGGCECPPGLPCACGAVPVGRLARRGALKSSSEEIARNPRAESARLRVLVRTGDPS